MEEILKQQQSSCLKVVLFGPESTGKTVLATQLAAHYKTLWVPEFSRIYAEEKARKNEVLNKDDVLPIARGQMTLENALAKQVDNLLFCDTNLLETKVYSEAYYEGYSPDILNKFAHQNTYNLYFLTNIDIPWEDDGIRDKPNERKVMFKAFEKALIKNNLPYVLLKGSLSNRMETAIKHIDKLLKDNCMFSDKDIQQIEKKGLTVAKVRSQIEVFKSGLPFVNLESAATINKGILKLSDEEKKASIQFFDTKRNSYSIIKFVPASGAATRMFKSFFSFIEAYNPEEETLNAYINRTNDAIMAVFLVGIEKLPFYQIVLDKIEEYYPDYQTASINKQRYMFVKTMLDEDKLNYGFYPKGLLPFHKYKEHTATAFEEHLFEAALYASANNKANLHYTISEKYKDVFDKEFQKIQNIVERKTNTKFEISFSYQKEATDTIAVTEDNKPFRQEDGSLLFRPSGHGALLSNLNDLDADIIFIKNIDNVVVFKYEAEVSAYKKMLAGILINIQAQAFHCLEKLENKQLSKPEILEIATLLSQKMNVVISSEFDKYAIEYQIEYLKDKLNRPIRVCGMVKNEGEPGGGPFWVKDENAQISLQIVESAQINKKDKTQKNILKNATHFNPVDVVCGIKDYKGKRFDLEQFVDPKTAFITLKTKTGKELKALELPGLWNGSMANWNTIFVEVPLITFNPVKTVVDLIKSTHQVK
ncbi:MAG: DUF4301 family protein [Xanthomarina sp.]